MTRDVFTVDATTSASEDEGGAAVATDDLPNSAENRADADANSDTDVDAEDTQPPPMEEGDEQTPMHVGPPIF